MKAYLIVFLGGGIGASLRFSFQTASARFEAGFPIGTLAINVVGSVLMGMAATWFAGSHGGWDARPLQLFLAAGVLGGFTTFSAFSLDAVILWQRGAPGLALAYVAASVFLSIAGLFVGMAIVRAG